MNSTFDGLILEALTERWWVPVLRGIAALAFGVLALVAPSASLLALVIVWGAYAIIDGVLNLVLAFSAGRAGARWGWYLFEGLLSVAAGVLTFAYPGITAMALLFVIAAWAIATGIVEIAAAIELRRVMAGEWLLGLSGVLSIVFGVLLFAYPSTGALAMMWLIGSYATVFGVVLIGLGVKLHRLRHGGAPGVPTGGTPTAA